MKAKVNLTIRPDVAEEARTLGVTVSDVAERAIAAADKIARKRAWVEANRDALEAYAAEVERDGSPLDAHRTF
jgi:antitoxin CcdA